MIRFSKPLHGRQRALTSQTPAGWRVRGRASFRLFKSAVAVKGQSKTDYAFGLLFHQGKPFLSDPTLLAAIAFHVSQMLACRSSA